MNDSKYEDDEEHQEGIENINHDLMGDNKSFSTLGIFNDSDNISNKHCNAHSIQRPHIPLPPHRRIPRNHGRLAIQPNVEFPRNVNEKRKRDDLEYQPSEKHFDAGLLKARAATDLYTCPSHLANETYYVDEDEELCQPPWFDDGMFLGAQGLDDVS